METLKNTFQDLLQKLQAKYGCPEDLQPADRDIFFEEEKKIQEEIKANLIRQKLDHLDLPKRFTQYTLDNYHPVCGKSQKIWQAVMDYLLKWPNVGNLIFIGEKGTGKTHLAVGLCIALCHLYYSCCYTKISRIIRAVRSSNINRCADPEQKIIDDFASPDLLVIDEIGVQTGTDYEKKVITEIIDDRYSADRKTVLVGNVSLSEMEKLIGDRAMERIREGSGDALVFDWQSYRQAQR